MEHDAQSSRRYKENWDDAVQTSKADTAEIVELKEAYALLFKAHADLRKSLELAVRQNEHDMLMTGEELRGCRLALGPNEKGNRPA